MNGGSTGKIYFLSGRGRRPSPKVLRKRPDPPPAAVDRRPPSPQETVWLARALFLEGIYLAVVWLAQGTELFAAGELETSRRWLVSFLPAEVFVACAAGFGGYELLRSSRRDVFPLLAAGGLVFFSLQRLTLLAATMARQALTPGERLEMTAMGICLGVGIWTVSHAMRARAAATS